MQTIKAIIFDFDGTLANTIPLCIASFRGSVEPLIQRPLSDDEIVAAFGPDERGTIARFTDKDIDEAMKHFMELYTSQHDEYAKVFEGIRELLESLKAKGIRLALATGKGKEACRFSMEKFSLLPYFEIIQTGSSKGSRKKEAIRQILEAFAGIDKTETIYVGDSAGDAKESREAGIRPVSVAWASNAKKEELEKEKPEQLFDTVPLFTEWLYKNI